MGPATRGQQSLCQTRPQGSQARRLATARPPPGLRTAQPPRRRAIPAQSSVAHRCPSGPIRIQPTRLARRRQHQHGRSPTRHLVVSRRPGRRIRTQRRTRAHRAQLLRFPTSRSVVTCRLGRQVRTQRLTRAHLLRRGESLAQPAVAHRHRARQISLRRPSRQHRQTYRPGLRPGHVLRGRRPGWRPRPLAGPRIRRRPRCPEAPPSSPHRPLARWPAAGGAQPAGRWSRMRQRLAWPVRQRRDSQALRASTMLRGRQPARGLAPAGAVAPRPHALPTPGGLHQRKAARPAAAVRPSGRWPPRRSPGGKLPGRLR